MPRRQTPSLAVASPLEPVRSAQEGGELLDAEEEIADDEGDVGGAGVALAGEPASWVVPDTSHGQRLDAFLAAAVPSFSRSHLKHLIEEGCAQVAGTMVTAPSRKVQAGQAVQVVLRPTAQSLSFVAEPMALPIVFEDEHLLVVDKPAGLVVHPAAGNWSGTLMNGLLAHHAGAASLPRAGIVHRLDKDTSGLMVVGKTVEAVTGLSRAIAARVVRRQYLAIVHGATPAQFTVDAAIGRDPVSRVRMALVASGKPARTDVERLLQGQCDDIEPGKAGGGGGRVFSGVLCTLHTGRTHQIRVHLASRKHPLVADALYGGAAALGLTRQALHAARLAFQHPASGQALSFTSGLPQDMAAAWARLGGETRDFTAGATTGA
jgi:23S rRNA pseudouridine1911/1915/1917 synthase